MLDLLVAVILVVTIDAENCGLPNNAEDDTCLPTNSPEGDEYELELFFTNDEDLQSQLNKSFLKCLALQSNKASGSACNSLTDGSLLSTTAATETTTVSTANTDSCNITFNGTCYWTHVQGDKVLDYDRAREICSNGSSIPAYFPNEEVYNRTVEDIRSKYPPKKDSVYVWTGVTIEPKTGKITHPSFAVYLKWGRNLNSDDGNTQLAIKVKKSPGDSGQGIRNTSPSRKFQGVACQRNFE